MEDIDTKIDNAASEALAAGMATACALIMDGLEPVIEASSGYREKLILAGFSGTAAEQMAQQVHIYLLGLVFQGFNQPAQPQPFKRGGKR